MNKDAKRERVPENMLGTLVHIALRAILCIIVFWITMGRPALSGPLEDADAAYARKDYTAAVNIWRELAVEGNTRAQLKLGEAYTVGLEVEKDYSKAIPLLEAAAAKGNPEAQDWLAFRYEYGQGVPKDLTTAFKWHQRAAAQGYPTALYSVGFAYIHGLGVPRNLIEAYKWLDLAVRSPTQIAPIRDEAAAARDAAAAELSPEQLVEARRLVAEWSPTETIP